MQLGMIGLGRMGAGLTRRLMRDGHEVAVNDVSPDAIAALPTAVDVNPVALESSPTAVDWKALASAF